MNHGLIFVILRDGSIDKFLTTCYARQAQDDFVRMTSLFMNQKCLNAHEGSARIKQVNITIVSVVPSSSFLTINYFAHHGVS